MIELAEAADVLTTGEPLIFETDTVVGVGISIKHNASPSSLYGFKNRSSKKPIAWLVSGISALSEFGSGVPDYAYSIANSFWPGALTIVVKASDKVPSAYVSPSGSIGLRMPNIEPIANLIDLIDSPIATTSANFSDFPPVKSVYELDGSFAPEVKRLVHFEEAIPTSVSSTVVDCTGSAPVVVRAGTITESDIDNCLKALEKR